MSRRLRHVGLAAAMAAVAATACSGGADSLPVALVARSEQGPMEVTTVVDGEHSTTTESGTFRRELDVEGSFSVEIVVSAASGAQVECAIEGLDTAIEGDRSVRCSASGSIEDGSLDYRSETEELG
jgi:hypothetical protein